MLTPDQVTETIPASLLPVADHADFLAALTKYPPPAVRLRPGFDDDTLPAPSVTVPWFARGRTFLPGVRPGGWLAYGTGAYYVQDAASLLTLALAAIRPGEVVCDLCAAPGGKSTGLAETLPPDGWLLANEPIRSRVDVLAMNLARHGSTRHGITSLDPDTLAARLPRAFDLVVVDAPCSGQSMLGEGKQTASAFLTSTVAHAAARQRRILAAAAALTRPGGRIVYATCTFAPAENEEIVTEFLATHPDWRVDPEPCLRVWESPLLAGSYRLWPHRDGCSGAFAVRLVLNERTDCDALEGIISEPNPRDAARAEKKSRKAHRGMSGRERDATVRLARETLPQETTEWGTWSSIAMLERGACRFGWTEEPPPGWRDVLIGGPEIAFTKGKTVFPSYALALRRDDLFSPHATVELADEDAAAYLRGEAVPIEQIMSQPDESDTKIAIRGWAIATWRQSPLGWIKSDGKWLKNHLPKAMSLRIMNET